MVCGHLRRSCIPTADTHCCHCTCCCCIVSLCTTDSDDEEDSTGGVRQTEVSCAGCSAVVAWLVAVQPGTATGPAVHCTSTLFLTLARGADVSLRTKVVRDFAAADSSCSSPKLRSDEVMTAAAGAQASQLQLNRAVRVYRLNAYQLVNSSNEQEALVLVQTQPTAHQ
jgi:hypothetical protein